MSEFDNGLLTFLAISCPMLQKYLFSSWHIEVASKTSWPFVFILDGKEEVEFCLFFLSKLLITFQVVEVFLLLLISVEKKDALAALGKLITETYVRLKIVYAA